MTKTAVVILNYNGQEYLEKFLPSLIDHSSNAEVIVIDNASTDDSRSWTESNHPQTHWIQLTENLGFAGGYNEGLKQVDADFYAIINSDVEVTKNWLSPLTEFLESNEEYAACQPKILSYNDKSHFEYAGAAGGFIDSLGFPYCRGRIFDSIEEDTGQYNDNLDIFWSTGACMVIRSKDFWDAGGFDDDFFAHMEEIDLCWRVNSMGRKIACIPSSMVYHVGGGTLSKQNSRKTYLNFRNGLSLLYKNLPYGGLWKLPIRIMLDWLAAVKFGLDNGFSHTFAVLRAQKDFFLLFPKNYNKRKNNVKSNPREDLQKTRLVVLSYFIYRKKRFRDL